MAIRSRDFLTNPEALSLKYENKTQTGGDIICGLFNQLDIGIPYYVVYEIKTGLPQPFVNEHHSWYGTVTETYPTGEYKVSISNDNLIPRWQRKVVDYTVLEERYFDIYVLNVYRLIERTRKMLKDIDDTCYAFSDWEISNMLEGSLDYFNGVPHFTDYNWDNLPQRFYQAVAQGAYLLGLAAQTLIESGREFNITDNGISFTPPPISTTLQTQHSNLYAAWVALVDQIKFTLKPSPSAVGTFRPLAVNPHLLKLRHLREKRIV